MVRERKIEIAVDRCFEPARCRLLFNGETTVFHCHHYTTLTCQLADDAQLFDGKAILRKAAEFALHETLRRIVPGDASVTERVALVEQYWMFCGMGTLALEKVGPMAATARMDHSHVDEGWLQKWGPREQPVNFIGQGFLCAALAVIYGLPPGSFNVQETQSLVSGAPCSRFNLVRK